MPRVTAAAEVTAVLLRLRVEAPALFTAVIERIRLIERDPSHPRARGATFKVPGGPAVHAVEVRCPEALARLTWALVEDEIRLVTLDVDRAAGS